VTPRQSVQKPQIVSKILVEKNNDTKIRVLNSQIILEKKITEEKSEVSQQVSTEKTSLYGPKSVC
jgi:hypothetical protein